MTQQASKFLTHSYNFLTDWNITDDISERKAYSVCVCVCVCVCPDTWHIYVNIYICTKQHSYHEFLVLVMWGIISCFPLHWELYQEKGWSKHLHAHIYICVCVLCVCGYYSLTIRQLQPSCSSKSVLLKSATSPVHRTKYLRDWMWSL